MKNVKTWIATLVVVILSSTTANAQVAFSGGNGTEESPYLISKAADLVEYSDSVQVNSSFSAGKYFKVTASQLDCRNITFTYSSVNGGPGVLGSLFGVFDGQGVVIKNLKFLVTMKTGSTKHAASLFSVIKQQGVLKNVTIDKSCTFENSVNGGAFAWDLYGTIENCHNYANLENGQAGITGYLNKGAVVRNCSNHGSGMRNGIAFLVDSAGDGSPLVEGCENTGNVTSAGIVGTGKDGMRIVNCTNSGKAKYGIGNNGTMENCVNTGQVSTYGIGSGTITGCRNTGKVAGDNNSYVAGIGYGTITGCVNTGDVTGRDAGGISATSTSILVGNIVANCTITASSYSGEAGAIACNSWNISNDSKNNYYINVRLVGTSKADVTEHFKSVSASTITTAKDVIISGLPTEGDGIVSYEGKTYYGNGFTADVNLSYQGTVSTGHSITYKSNSGSLVKNNDGTYKLTMSGVDMEVKGEIVVNTYTLTYMKDGGTAMLQQQYNYGEDITIPQQHPYKEGHDFDGWDGLPEDMKMPAHDVTVTPRFKPHLYYIYYKVDGEEYKKDSLAYGSAFKLMDEPQKEGYTFSGWKGDCPETMPAYSLYFYGNFTINTYTVTFMSDGQQFGKELSVKFGETITLPANTPAKKGYTFDRWDGLPEDMKMPAHDVTCEALFTINSYTLSWVVDGVTLQSDILKYGEKINSLPAPEQEGKTFSGWSTIPETMPDHDVTVVGSFDANKYTITYLLNGEQYQTVQVNYGDNIVTIPDVQREGYTFSGWSEHPETMPAENITISATLTINQYRLTFIFEEETKSSELVDYGTAINMPEVEEREGYHVEWEATTATMPAKDVTVKGGYVPNSYKLTYLVDGDVYETINVKFNTAITPLEEPMRTGYTFSGWSEIPETMPAHNVDVTGTFTINKHELTFTLDGKEYQKATLVYNQRIDYPEITCPEGYYVNWNSYYSYMPDKDLTIDGKTELMTSIRKTIDDVEYYISLRGQQYASIQKYSGDRVQMVIPETINAAGFDIPVTRIADRVFRSNSRLKLLTLPDSIEEIGEEAFRDCRGIVFGKLPANIKHIGKQAFRDCWGITNLMIPEGCTRIDDEAFLYCTRMLTVTFKPEKVTLGERVFQNCYNLAFAELPEKTAAVPAGMFQNCSALTAITLPATVKEVNDNAFAGCQKLKDVYCYAEEVPYALATAFDENTISTATLYVPEGKSESYAAANIWKDFGTIKELSYNNLTYWVDGVLYKTYEHILVGTALTPEANPVKENREFSGWHDLPTVMPDHDVKAVGGFAYQLTYMLDTQAEHVQTLFYGEEVVVPEKLQRQGYALTVTGLPTVMPAEDISVNMTYTINQYKADYIIEGKVVHTEMVNFNERVPLPEATKREGFDFQWLEVPSRMPAHDITIYGEYTPQRMATEVIDGVTYNIYLQEGWAEVTAQPEGQYTGTVEIAPMVTYTAASFTVKAIADYAFMSCKQLTEVTIPNTMESIGVQAFRDCWSLKSITLPASVTKLEKEAFMYCNALKTVECKADMPPTTGEDVFKNVPLADAELIVYRVCMNLYKTRTPWNNFGTISAFEGPDFIESIHTGQTRTDVPIYHLNGSMATPAGSTARLPKGIYIQQGKKVIMEK